MNFLKFSFEFPWALLGLIPLFGILWLFWKRPEPSVRFSSVTLFVHAKRFKIRGRRLILFLLYALAGAGMVIALAGPRFGIGELVQRSQGVDILVAIDLSGSMAAYDTPTGMSPVQVQNRIEGGAIQQRIDVCKKEIKHFIELRPNDRIGLIAFAEQAYAVCPPTLDHAWLQAQVDRLQLHTIGDGTGIAAPIAAAVERLKDSDAKRKVMVLFTDGQNTAQNKLTPMQTANIAKDYHVTIHTVGIGSKQSYVIQQVWGRNRLTRYDSQFDENLLRKISKVTEGQYYAAEDAEGMRKAMEAIDLLEVKPQELPTLTLHREAASDVAGLAGLLLLTAFGLSHTVFLRYP